MASFQTMKNGKVRASVCVKGKRDSNTFLNKQKAKSWARDREYELSKQADGIDDSTTLGDLFKRYAEEISPLKRAVIGSLSACKNFNSVMTFANAN